MVRSMLFLLFLILAPITNAGEKYPNFTRQIYISGVGQAKLEYSYAGEPVSRPRYLALSIKCPTSEAWQPLGRYLMCELKNYKYDAKNKKLRIEYLDARVNQQTGESFCDQFGKAEFDFTHICK